MRILLDIDVTPSNRKISAKTVQSVLMNLLVGDNIGEEMMSLDDKGIMRRYTINSITAQVP